MGDGGAKALGQALGAPAGPHLDDETLAALATAEAAGESLEALYPEAVAHIETCVRCAKAYAELAEMMMEAVASMASAARRMSPEEVYAGLLARRLAAEGAHDVQSVVERAAARLPALFTDLPAGPEEVTPGLIAEAMAVGEVEEEAAGAAQRVTELVREQLSALTLYLQGAAATTWERAVAVTAEVGGRRQEVALAQDPAPGVIREAQSEYRAPEEEGRLPVTLRAVRLSTIACRLEVQVEGREGGVAGAVVRVHLPGREETVVTDDQGLATFAPVPIAALPHLLVRVEEG